MKIWCTKTICNKDAFVIQNGNSYIASLATSAVIESLLREKKVSFTFYIDSTHHKRKKNEVSFNSKMDSKKKIPYKKISQ